MADPTTAGEFWYGGREGYLDYSEEWVATRSWYFYKLVSRIEFDFTAIRVYLKLRVAGSPHASEPKRGLLSLKGRCKPTHAVASVGLGYERYHALDCPLLETRVDTLQQAKRRAEDVCTPQAIERLLRKFYSPQRGSLIEKLTETGWQEWLWLFEDHPDWGRLSDGYTPMRYTNSEGAMFLVDPSYGGWAITSWPSVWDRVSYTGWAKQDSFGVL